ncbi:MAG: heme exporter protein CcmD [Endozoicomonas sp.]
MHFDSWTGFLEMGGHGLYVWSAYGVAFLVIAYNLLAPIRGRRQVRERVQRQERLEKTGNNRRQDRGVIESTLNRLEPVESTEPFKSQGVMNCCEQESGHEPKWRGRQ